MSGHGPTPFAADELGNHGNAYTDATNIPSFAWAKEEMCISEDVNKTGGGKRQEMPVCKFPQQVR